MLSSKKYNHHNHNHPINVVVETLLTTLPHQCTSSQHVKGGQFARSYFARWMPQQNPEDNPTLRTISMATKLETPLSKLSRYWTNPRVYCLKNWNLQMMV